MIALAGLSGGCLQRVAAVGTRKAGCGADELSSSGSCRSAGKKGTVKWEGTSSPQLLLTLKASGAVGWGPAREGCAPCRPRWSSSKTLHEQCMLTDAPWRMDGEIFCSNPRTKQGWLSNRGGRMPSRRGKCLNWEERNSLEEG